MAEMNRPMTPPVLIIAWRRPAAVTQVIEAVRSARPEHLFVAVDGPDDVSRPGESSAVAATIAAIESAIDWRCDVRRRYATTNLGCRHGVTSAIDWFFSEVEEGIILEDDCVPDPDFFPYCAELLDRYRGDKRIMCISGDNSGQVTPRLRRKYSFVRYPQIWGWATWKRAWDSYDRDLERYRAARRSGAWAQAVPDRLERDVFTRRLDHLVATGEPDTWDYQWAATVLLDGGLSIHPHRNLVSNIGFGSGATHTFDPTDRRSTQPSTGILPLRHPRAVHHHRTVSRQLFLATQISAGKRHAQTGTRRLRKVIRLVRRRIFHGAARAFRAARRFFR